MPVVGKEVRVAMLRSAGMDEAATERWHAAFEQRAPQAHHDILLSLGIAENKALRIRALSARGRM